MFKTVGLNLFKLYGKVNERLFRDEVTCHGVSPALHHHLDFGIKNPASRIKHFNNLTFYECLHLDLFTVCRHGDSPMFICS